MLSGIPASRFWRARPSPSSKVVQNAINSPTSLGLLDRLKVQEQKDLSELNQCLAVLAAIFPDVNPQVFREMLQTFSAESRLELITEAILKHKAKWVRGRWKVNAASTLPHKGGEQRLGMLPQHERFRTLEYKNAVKLALYDEFKGLGHSTIKAILAEHNHAYTESREALLEEIATSWRYTIAKFLFRRKAPAAEAHPLLKSGPSSSADHLPTLLRTGCDELDKELEETLVTPLRAQVNAKRLRQDNDLAVKLNEEEAEALDSLFECECCFTSSTFEEIATCNIGQHVICFRCLRFTLNEALFGQGWAKAFDPSQCTLRCVAVSTGQEDPCNGSIPFDLVRRAVHADEKGEETLRKFHQRVASDSIQKSGLRVSQCTSCSYAEADSSTELAAMRHDLIFIGAALLIPLCVFGPYSSDLDLFQLCCIYLILFLALRHVHQHPLMASLMPMSPLQRQSSNLNNGTKFICRNPECSLVSCLRCLAPWTDPHACYTSTRLALRTYVESAVSGAVKRTCPRCNVSFIKSSGCNKLVCVCGYAMCYICRADIGKEGYMHFCQHFRAEPGARCRECDRCDLYLVEDEEDVIKRARMKAVKEWREMQGKGKVEGLDEVEKEVLSGVDVG